MNKNDDGLIFRVKGEWWYAKYRVARFFREGIAQRIAMCLPRKVVMFALVRVAAYASMGERCGTRSPDVLTYELMYKEWEEQGCGS
jgi:hypothetical protein